MRAPATSSPGSSMPPHPCKLDCSICRTVSWSAWARLCSSSKQVQNLSGLKQSTFSFYSCYMPSWVSLSAHCPHSTKSKLRKPSPSQMLLTYHQTGGKMKCSPTWNEGSLPLTWHCSDCSHGLTLPRGAQEVKFFLVLRRRRARNV